jgi:hypothetical protein
MVSHRESRKWSRRGSLARIRDLLYHEWGIKRSLKSRTKQKQEWSKQVYLQDDFFNPTRSELT